MHENLKTWVSATAIRNYFIRDPFLDWAKYHHFNYLLKNKPYAEKLAQSRKSRTHRWFKVDECPTVSLKIPSFSKFIMDQGNRFEECVVNNLYHHHKQNIVDAGHSYDETLKAMKSGSPIIYRGLVLGNSTKTFGIPDLIVRSDWIRKIVTTSPIPREEEEVGAPAIGTDRFHYRPIDIKFSTLDLKTDGTHLRNSRSVLPYKGQLCIYVQAIGEMQGYDPGVGYILGKRWKYNQNKIAYKGSSCFDRLGTIDFRPERSDFKIKERVKDAVAWVNRVRNEGSGWDPYDPRRSPPELSPNMSNRQDSPWRAVKEVIAEDTKEITQMWMCGPKERTIALELGIKSWTDTDFTSDLFKIPLNGTKYRLIKQILRVNRESHSSVLPDKLFSNIFTFPHNLEFFVDFEMVNEGTVDDFKKFPIAKTDTFIFMIGVGYCRPVSGIQTRAQKKKMLQSPQWIFRSFVADSLSLADHNKICANFSAYINKVSAQYGDPNPPLYHWGHAEPSMWNKNRESQLHRWVDLLSAFKQEEIAIRGCLNYNLKNISTALHNLGYIKTFWNKSNPCTNGADAMIQAYTAYQECKKRQSANVQTSLLMKNIGAYNEIDCRVLMEILQILRHKHV